MARPRKARAEPDTASEPKRVPHPELGAKLKAIVAERTKAENKLLALQDDLRELDRDQKRGTPEYDAQLAKVNEMRDEIGRIGVEHHNLSSAFSYASGGVVHVAPPTA
jgi:chromosome condensin MukBEF ATPase and DNA-binding subunit MukB